MKGASPGSKPAKSSEKNSPKNIKMQETEAAIFSFLEDRKRKEPGITLTVAMAGWKALAKTEKEANNVVSEQKKNTLPASQENSQDRRLYKMLVDDDDSTQNTDIAPVPMPVEQEGTIEGTGDSVGEEKTAESTGKESAIICEPLETVDTVETAMVTTTYITPTTQLTTTQVQRAVIPVIPGEEQKGHIVVEDYFSVKPQPVGEGQGEASSAAITITTDTLPTLLQDDESCVAEDPITLKVKEQGGEEMLFKVKKGTAMRKIMRAYADRKGVNLTELRFTLDGARVNPEDTPKMLELEESVRIDAHREFVGGGDLENVNAGAGDALSAHIRKLIELGRPLNELDAQTGQSLLIQSIISSNQHAFNLLMNAASGDPGADIAVNEPLPQGWHALQLAVNVIKDTALLLSVCERLIDCGADIKATNASGNCALTEAVVRGHVALMDLFLPAYSKEELETPNKTGATLCLYAVCYSQVEALRKLVEEKGVNATAHLQAGESLMAHGMLSDGSVLMMEYLYNTRYTNAEGHQVRLCGDLNVRGERGRTPLVQVILKGEASEVNVKQDQLVAWLASKPGVDLTARDEFGFNALIAAACRDRQQVLDTLLSYPAVVADINSKSQDGCTAYNQAVRRKFAESAKKLAKKGADTAPFNQAVLDAFEQRVIAGAAAGSTAGQQEQPAAAEPGALPALKQSATEPEQKNYIKLNMLAVSQVKGRKSWDFTSSIRAHNKDERKKAADAAATKLAEEPVEQKRTRATTQQKGQGKAPVLAQSKAQRAQEVEDDPLSWAEETVSAPRKGPGPVKTLGKGLGKGPGKGPEAGPGNEPGKGPGKGPVKGPAAPTISTTVSATVGESAGTAQPLRPASAPATTSAARQGKEKDKEKSQVVPTGPTAGTAAMEPTTVERAQAEEEAEAAIQQKPEPKPRARTQGQPRPSVADKGTAASALNAAGAQSLKAHRATVVAGAAAAAESSSSRPASGRSLRSAPTDPAAPVAAPTTAAPTKKEGATGATAGEKRSKKK